VPVLEKWLIHRVRPFSSALRPSFWLSGSGVPKYKYKWTWNHPQQVRAGIRPWLIRRVRLLRSALRPFLSG